MVCSNHCCITILANINIDEFVQCEVLEYLPDRNGKASIYALPEHNVSRATGTPKAPPKRKAEGSRDESTKSSATPPQDLFTSTPK